MLPLLFSSIIIVHDMGRYVIFLHQICKGVHWYSIAHLILGLLRSLRTRRFIEISWMLHFQDQILQHCHFKQKAERLTIKILNDQAAIIWSKSL